MKNYNEFLKEANFYSGGNDSQDSNKNAAYSDLTGKQRKELDTYCSDKYGKTFLDATFDEQSSARSVIWSEKEDPDEIEKQNDKDKNF